jgi:AraC-like DNA-binding protein
MEIFISGTLVLLIFVLISNPKKVNLKGNTWMAAFLLLVCIMIFDKIIFEDGFYQIHYNFIGVSDFFLFLLAPTFYFTIVYFVSVDRKFTKVDVVHFIVPLLSVLLTILLLFKNKQRGSEEMEIIKYPFEMVNIVIFSQNIFYWVLAYKKLQKHQRDIQFFSSSPQKIDLNWLKFFLFAVAGMIAVSIVEVSLENYFTFKFGSICYLFLIFFIAFHTQRQSEIFPFSPKTKIELSEIIHETEPAKKKERLQSREVNDLKNRLETIMATDKYYLDESLNLPKLAEVMEISTHDLSYLLNDGLDQSFFQFINSYRIDEAKRLLLSDDHKHLNMVGIAFAAGFNSKTTFNTTFKKFTALSPSEFVALQKVNG